MELVDHADSIYERVAEGKTFKEIAQEFGVSIGTLHAFLYQEEHQSKTKLALFLSASQYADMATEVLKNAETSAEIYKARELAQHYRWMASKRSPRQFGDRLDLTSEGNAAGTVIVLPPKNREEDSRKQLQAIADRLNGKTQPEQAVIVLPSKQAGGGSTTHNP